MTPTSPHRPISGRPAGIPLRAPGPDRGAAAVEAPSAQPLPGEGDPLPAVSRARSGAGSGAAPTRAPAAPRPQVRPAKLSRGPNPGAYAGRSLAAAPSARSAAALRRVVRRLLPDRGDRDVLWMYVATRVGLWVVAYCTRWLFPDDREARDAGAVVDGWQRWDWDHYLHIARDGYFPGGAGPGSPGWDNREAFFPGFPLVLRAVHAVVPSWAVSGLLVSFAAGAVAVVALARIARHYAGGSAVAGRYAAGFFLVSPCAVFLAAGYTEALFLACALPAWSAALRGRWAQAGLLAAGASAVRVSGLFLAVALMVQFAVSRAGASRRGTSRARWRSAGWLVLPGVPVAAFAGFLYARTGDWWAWRHAEERGWHREFHAPWRAWRTTWEAAFGGAYPTGYAVEWQGELLAMAGGVVLLAVLLWRRWWAEAVYVGLTLWALGTSYWYMSVPRASLLWWPLWVLLARWAMRRPRVAWGYAAVVAPVGTVVAVAFLSGRWAG